MILTVHWFLIASIVRKVPEHFGFLTLFRTSWTSLFQVKFVGDSTVLAATTEKTTARHFSANEHLPPHAIVLRRGTGASRRPVELWGALDRGSGNGRTAAAAYSVRFNVIEISVTERDSVGLSFVDDVRDT